MKSSDCAAKRHLEEIRAKAAANPTAFYTSHQNIEGIIVPPPTVDQGSRPQIIQKSTLNNSGPTSFTQDIPVNSQAVGQSSTNTSYPTKNYKSFSNTESNKFLKPHTIQKENTAMSQSHADGSENEGHKMKFSQSGLLHALHLIREPVVDYQEARGVPRNEEVTFLTLVTSLCTQAYTAAITILVMLWNLMPLVDGFIYFIRFMLDKTIDIVQTEDNKDRAVKAAILFGELTIIFFIIFMIVGLIFMPVYVLIARLFSKIFSMIAW